MSCSRRMLRRYCNERPKEKWGFIYSFFFPAFFSSPSSTNNLPVSLYDVQYAPFLLSTSMALLVAAVHGNYSPLHFKYSNPWVSSPRCLW